MAARRLVLGVIAMTVLVCVSLIAGFVSSAQEISIPSANLADLKERQVIYLEDDHVFLVHHRDEVFALSDDAQHVGDTVRYCASSGLFESTAHGEKFDIRGVFLAGPALRGLDRYEVRVEGGVVLVDLQNRIEGPARGEMQPLDPIGPFCPP